MHIVLIVLKVVLTVLTAAIAMFCVFGFFASAEAGPEAANGFRLLYGTVELACVAAIAAIWLVKWRKP